MALEYTGSGGAETFGCAETSMLVYYEYPFGEGSVAYLRYKAEKGVLERVVIKKVIIRQNRATWGQVIFLYQDTLNALFNESDLITHEQAVGIAEAYYERVRLDAIAAMKMCK